MSITHNHYYLNTTITQHVCIRKLAWYPKQQLVEFPSFVLQLQLIVVYCLTQALHHTLFKHFGLPPLASQLTAGVILSPELYNGKIKVLKSAHESIFPEMSSDVWKGVAMLGFSLSIFIISVKTDFNLIKRTGKKPIVIGLLVLILTTFWNTTVALIYGKVTNLDKDQKQMRELTASASVLALSTFPVIAVLLSDLKLLNSELGRLALSCGIIGEVVGVSNTLVTKSIHHTITLLKQHKKRQVILQVGNRVVGLIAFLLCVIYIVRPWMIKIIKHTPKGRPIKDTYFIFVILLMLVGGIITDINGEFVIVGCFVMGAAVPAGPPLGSAIVNKFDTFISGILQPFLITMSAMRANVLQINFQDKLIRGELLVTLSAFAAKTIICLGCGLHYDMATSDALALAAIVSSKGIVDIGIYNMFIDSQMIGDSTYAYLILVTTVGAIIIPITITYLYHPLRKYAGYENRDIVTINSEAHLRIIVGIYRPDHVFAFAHLLALSNPSKNSMIVDVLHLIKLAGRAQPIFIAHDLQEGNAFENMSYSEDVISAFSSILKRANLDSLFTHFYTTVSQPKAMHGDICTLALDNLASLIVLPYHRKLSTLDGSIESEDPALRALNNNILERAPCSVGIFINRGTIKLPTFETSNLTSISVESQSTEKNEFSAAVIFIGGTDDQEAVAYAKRMSLGSKVWVLVIRIVAFGDDSELDLHDFKTLSEIREYKTNNPQFNYSEQVVRDGSQTAKMLRSITEEFDLIIVGRRHKMDCPQTSGLQQWSEVNELGILGDILASPDFPGTKTSILVIQHQKQWTFKGYK
ncbi:unnamed protein product [Amaranthus hypochondriacus]